MAVGGMHCCGAHGWLMGDAWMGACMPGEGACVDPRMGGQAECCLVFTMFVDFTNWVR